MDSLSRRDFIKTSAGILVVGGLVTPKVPQDVLGIVKVTQLPSVAQARELFVTYETHQHSINDFARDALNRYPDTQWIDLMWPGDEYASFRWAKRRDGWHSMQRSECKELGPYYQWVYLFAKPKAPTAKPLPPAT
jgi:hypothetical protein